MSLHIASSVPLHDKNWFQTGGAARFFCQPHTNAEFQEALMFAKTNNLSIFVLGEGANILVSDDGFDGLVIRPKNVTIVHCDHPTDTQSVQLTAGAGATIAHLIDYCLAHNIIGLEEFSNIPGTVGGSVFINLHYYSFFLSDFLESAHVIHKETGVVETVTVDWFNFGYDQSRLMEGNHILLQATFKLKKATDLETAFAHGRKVEIVRHRVSRYPTARTCGSFFRNFHPDEVTLTSEGKKVIWVAYYLDKIGVKGHLSIGDAIVSYQHANMLVNKGKATSHDLVMLAKKMQELVHAQFNIIPQPECLLIGFKDYPLLKGHSL